MYENNIDPAAEIRKISRGPSKQGKMASDKEFLEVNQTIEKVEDRKGNLDKARTEIKKLEEPNHEQILRALADC